GVPDLECEPGTLLEDLPGWDSMLHIAVMVELECRFGITVAPDEVDAMVSVGDLVRMVGAKQVLNAP
ncbi:MAG: acyl carrier protein, partial [Rhodospirillales bacterium]|nr:acyl carrier protein [Rhodospirillales bacterium]